jgi:hypothetical protein
MAAGVYDPPVAEAKAWVAGRTFAADHPLLDLSQAVPGPPPPPPRGAPPPTTKKIKFCDFFISLYENVALGRECLLEFIFIRI